MESASLVLTPKKVIIYLKKGRFPLLYGEEVMRQRETPK